MFGDKVRPSEFFALIAALVLLIATFSAWFTLPAIDELRQLAPNANVIGGGDGGAINLNVWDLHFTRWFVYLSVLLAVCMFLAALLSRTADWSMILATPLTVCSFVAAIGMTYRVIDSPRDFADATGWFYVAVISSLTLFAAACWAIRDESVPAGFDQPPSPERLQLD
ncbi:MAG: hypothetical protein ACPGYP_00880 [Solirubrobacterales bacterium]